MTKRTTNPLIYSILLFDIEGTLSPLTFVHKILFPFILKNLNSYINLNLNSNSHFNGKEKEEFIQLVNNLREQAKEDLNSNNIKLQKAPQIPLNNNNNNNEDQDNINNLNKAIELNVRWQMSWDRKGGALKNLQGQIWKNGYETKELEGFVYDDVPLIFKELEKRGIPIYIYSSGSVLGQKLLFKYSNYGDLLPFLKGHYDTGIGSKLEKKSYEKIKEEIGGEGKILFVSDNVKGR